MSNQRPSYHAVLNLKPRCFPSRKAFAAVPATVLMVLLYVSCVFSDDSDVFQVVIGPELRECGGQGDMKCMMVNGELFMGVIENFEYMEGYDYILKVSKASINVRLDVQHKCHSLMPALYQILTR